MGGMARWLEAKLDVVFDAMNSIGEADVQAGYSGQPAVVFKRKPPSLKSNRESVLIAITLHPRAIQFADSKWRADRAVCVAAVSQDGLMLRHCSEDMCNDPTVVLAAVGQFGQAIQFAGHSMRATKAVALRAVQRDGWALQYIDEALLSDKDVGLAAVSENPMSLGHLSESLRSDRDVVLKAVQSGGKALQYAHPSLRDDSQVVLAAVSSDGRALQHASIRLRGDRRVVEVAVSQSAAALRHADHGRIGAAAIRGNLSELAAASAAAVKIETVWRGRKSRQVMLASLNQIREERGYSHSDAELQQLMLEASSRSMRNMVAGAEAAPTAQEESPGVQVRQQHQWADRQHVQVAAAHQKRQEPAARQTRLTRRQRTFDELPVCSGRAMTFEEVDHEWRIWCVARAHASHLDAGTAPPFEPDRFVSAGYWWCWSA